jgi:hypothetical protein
MTERDAAGISFESVRLTDIGPMTADRFRHELIRPLPQLPPRDFVLRPEVREFYCERVEKLSDDTTQPYRGGKADSKRYFLHSAALIALRTDHSLTFIPNPIWSRIMV